MYKCSKGALLLYGYRIILIIQKSLNVSNGSTELHRSSKLVVLNEDDVHMFAMERKRGTLSYARCIQWTFCMHCTYMAPT